MERIQDTYLDTIQSIVSLKGKFILEVGCGTGVRTAQIAQCCDSILAIDPNVLSIQTAQELNPVSNGSYVVAVADALPAEDQSVDIVFFTLSFHHVSLDRMNVSITEALRVVKQSGHIIFFEPAFEGSFFDAEILFDGCDGDERQEKAYAYATMLAHPGLRETKELYDETVFRFESAEDFIEAMHPKKGSVEEVKRFLEERQFLLSARRRINVFVPASC